MTRKRKDIVVAVSGGFDPVHVGHIELFERARTLGDRLVVILNSDAWLLKKKGYIFMPEKERKKVLEALRVVDEVFLYTPKPFVTDVVGALKKIRPHIFANGGDRKVTRDIPEAQVCKEIGIQMVFGCGTTKPQSSSWLVENVRKSSVKKGRNKKI